MFEQFRWGWLISFPSFQHVLMNSFLRNFLLEIFKRYIPNVYELVPQPTGLADSWHPFNWYHHMKCILHPHHFLSLSAFPTHFLTFPIISFRTCSFPFTLLSILSPSSLHPLLPLLPIPLRSGLPSPQISLCLLPSGSWINLHFRISLFLKSNLIVDLIL